MMDGKDNSEYRKEWMLEVLKVVYSRLTHFRETFRLTEEVREALDRNDRTSAQLLLDMRGEELEAIDADREKLYRFLEQFPEDFQQEIKEILKGELTGQQEPEAARIVETVKASNMILKQIVAIDKRMSKHVAGTDSFYDK